MVEVKGNGGISAKIIADSVSSVNGKRITTFELEYPRFIHAEFMTHRLFSRNAASSRAIPIEKVIEQVDNNPAMPIHWGKNQAGMQAQEEISGSDKWGNERKELVIKRWIESSKMQSSFAQEFSNHHLHKQVVNRILEPYQFIKVVCTATEFDNFFWLRCHEDAQPEIKELADCMYLAYSENDPQELHPGEWHTPYVRHMTGPRNEIWYYIDDGAGGDIILELEDALKVSASCCAQVSYRKTDDSLDKAEKIYKALVESKPVHASPFEHQATPLPEINIHGNWPFGVTHMDNCLEMWSGNFCGWIQHRQLIIDHDCKNYIPKDE